MKIKVLPPNVNESFAGFTVVKDGETGADEIRFGLTTIKNFGEGIGAVIIAERKRGGKFKSLEDFLTRVNDKNLNKKSLEALIKSGALEEFGERGQLLFNLENLLSFSKEKDKNSKDQDSLFGKDTSSSSLHLLPAKEVPMNEKLSWEKELLGLYISGHPLERLRDKLLKKDISIEKMKNTSRDGQDALAVGITEEIKEIRTKKGDLMAFVKIADFSASVEVVFFPKIYEEFKQFLSGENCLAIEGKVSHRNGNVSLLADRVKVV